MLVYHREIWVQSLREAMSRVVMGCPDLNAASFGFQSDGCIDHQSLGSPDAEVWMDEHHPYHPTAVPIHDE